MKTLSDLIHKYSNGEDGVKVVFDNGLVGERLGYPLDLDVVWDGDKIIAISQCAMLHETLLVFETERNDVLELDGIEPQEYELQDTGIYDETIPPCAAFLRRMPGYYYTSAKYRMQAELVRRKDGEPEFRMNENIDPDDDEAWDDVDFHHAVSYIAQQWKPYNLELEDYVLAPNAVQLVDPASVPEKIMPEATLGNEDL